MDERAEAQEVARQVIADQRSSQQRIVSASDQILKLSSQMQLTWEEFEKAVELVKRYGHICP